MRFGPIRIYTSQIWEAPREFDKLSREFSQTELTGVYSGSTQAKGHNTNDGKSKYLVVVKPCLEHTSSP